MLSVELQEMSSNFMGWFLTSGCSDDVIQLLLFVKLLFRTNFGNIHVWKFYFPFGAQNVKTLRAAPRNWLSCAAPVQGWSKKRNQTLTNIANVWHLCMAAIVQNCVFFKFYPHKKMKWKQPCPKQVAGNEQKFAEVFQRLPRQQVAMRVDCEMTDCFSE